ncbi:hypothetical protein GCM10012285_01840 [Streptomyces kronopolitis]|uniref:Uncharacterized protein n=1 Tax=Streptomyces kronopolitis TaxID=1612435 RepID=A0ABQ2IZ20_9ACTN|nr:hypothetical protein GCM10012285_01840 [Streptomyces kronopolitis]
MRSGVQYRSISSALRISSRVTPLEGRTGAPDGGGGVGPAEGEGEFDGAGAALRVAEAVVRSARSGTAAAGAATANEAREAHTPMVAVRVPGIRLMNSSVVVVTPAGTGRGVQVDEESREGEERAAARLRKRVRPGAGEPPVRDASAGGRAAVAGPRPADRPGHLGP